MATRSFFDQKTGFYRGCFSESSVPFESEAIRNLNIAKIKKVLKTRSLFYEFRYENHLEFSLILFSLV